MLAWIKSVICCKIKSVIAATVVSVVVVVAAVIVAVIIIVIYNTINLLISWLESFYILKNCFFKF